MDTVLEALFERQTFILKNKQLKIDPRTFVVLDDVLREEQMIRYSKNLRTLFTDGRHYKIFTLVTTQYAKGVPTEVRGNTDCAIIFKQFQFMQRESICNDYLDLLPEKYLRYALLDAHTGGENEEDRHKGLAVVTSKLSSRMSETLRTVHAEEVPDDFLMGDPEFWFAAANGDLMRLRNTFVEGASVKKAKPKLREEKKAKSKAKK